MRDPLDRVTVDMDLVTRTALGMRRWRLEYETNGIPAVWTGEAANEAAANTVARHQLALPAGALLVVCREVP